MRIGANIRRGEAGAPSGGVWGVRWGSFALRYGFAVVGVAIGTALRLWLMRLFGPIPLFITLYPSVLLVAIIAGTGPGIVASLLAAVAARYFYMQPVGLGWVAPNDILALGIFTCANLLICILAEQLRQGRMAEALSALQQEELAERKAAAEELRHSEQRYRELVQNANSAIIRWKSDGTVVFINEFAQMFFGYSADEILGQHVNVLIHGTEPGSVAPEGLVQDIVRNPNHYVNNVNENVCRDGRRVWMTWTNKPILDDSGNVAEILAVGSDITERKRVEEQLREVTQRLTYHMDTAPLAVIEWGPDMRIIRWSGESERIFGWKPEEVLGKKMTDFRWIYTEDRAQVSEVAADLQAGADSRRFSANRNYRKDGSIIYCEWYNSSLLDEMGKVRSVLSLVLDVTDRKKTEEALRTSERMYRAIGETIDYGVWVCAPDGRTVYTSESFLKLVGLTPEQCADFGWASALHPDDAERTIAAWKECVRTGGTWDMEHRFKGADGQYHATLDRGVPVRDEHGQITCWAGINLDISRIKGAEQALREADQRKNEFLAILAHELRNQLTPMRNAVQMISTDAHGNPCLLKNSEMIERQVGHMERLVNDLLDVSRVSRGQLELKMELLDLRKVVGQAVEVAEHAIKGRRLEIAYNPPSAPVWIEGDCTRLEQITGNLLNNAIKYTDEGLIQVSLDTERADGDSGRAVLRVRDSGIGIPAQMLPHIFDLYTQVNHTRDRRRGGLGIGLTMVERLVSMHGGTIQANSDGADKGSEFVVRLPLAVAAQTGGEVVMDETAGEVPGDNRKRSVLVVDDSRDAAESMSDILSLWGYVAETALDGPSAIKRAMENPPDVILLDIGLPEMSGIEVARLVRSEPTLKHARIIAITGYGQDELANLSGDSGFDAHMVKPVDLSRLRSELARMIGP